MTEKRKPDKNSEKEKKNLTRKRTVRAKKENGPGPYRLGGVRRRVDIALSGTEECLRLIGMYGLGPFRPFLSFSFRLV
jgi:hypothetical protein